MKDYNDKQATKTKKKYQKPQLKSEKVMTFGAQSNGAAPHGPKAKTRASDVCQSSRLLS